MRVLIPTQDTSLLPALCEAYRAAGWEAFVGVPNVALRAARFDVVHIHWPEALAAWRTPTERDLARILDDLAWWRQRATIVGTVHNLAPHGRFDNELDRLLFAKVYEACHLITHFSSFSRAELVRLHPSLAGARHLVHRPMLYDDLLSLGRGRAAARATLGVAEGDFVIAAFGQLREEAEFKLLEAGVRGARVARKRPILAARSSGSKRSRIFRRVAGMLPFVSGLGRPAGTLPAEEMVALCEAADVLVIPRYPPHLNSGVMQTAMTFGTPMAVPSYGVYQEYLGDAGCAFYPPADARGLAAAIEKIAASDHDALVARNREVASDWGWRGIVSAIVSEVPRAP